MARPSSPTPAVLLAGLLAAVAYAAFAGGAVALSDELWLQVGLALLAILAAAAWLGPGALRPAASPYAIAGLLLLVVFAAWIGASLLWSVTPDRTWEAVNRVLGYALVVATAILAGSSAPRAIERVAAGFLVIATAVAVWALAGKLFPGVVDHATQISRLRAPLEYWNALALLCVLAVPIAIRTATLRGLHARWRILALVALLLLLSCIGLTYSRGAVVALVVAVVVLTAVGGPRLPGLAVLALGLLAAAPVLAFAWSDETLSTNARPLGEQIDAGLQLGLVLALAAALLAITGWWLLRLEQRASWSPVRSRQVWLTLAAVLLGLAAGGVAVVATSERGLRGSIEHAADSFTEVERDPIYDPGRLLSTGSGNRWAWWSEAVGAASDEPVLGWGAGAFPVSRRLYREAPADVQQAHSVPLQWLADVGAVGLALGLAALALLFAAAAQRLRVLPSPREYDLAGALLAGCAAWAAHALLDWDWDIPGVTLPVLLFLGVLGARRAADRPAAEVLFEEPRPVRPLALFCAGVLACAFIVSAVLPGWADRKADDALDAAGDRSPARLEAAARDAELAADLDPLAVRPLFAAAAVAEARGRLLEARRHLLDAVERQPYSLEAWRRLTRVAVALADREGVQRASQRALELDPGDPELIRFVSRAQGILTPPEASASATGTPLTSGTAAPAPDAEAGPVPGDDLAPVPEPVPLPGE
jgi:hypothetical protein